MIPIDQEPDAVPRGLIKLATVVIVVTIVASIASVLLLAGARLRQVILATKQPDERIETRMFELPTDAELAGRAAADRLAGYGWVDRSRGIVHVPLEVAIELYLAERQP